MTAAARHPASKHAQPHPAKPKPKTGFESWVDGIDKADGAWDVYDCEIRSAVEEFNMHLSHTPRYVPLDWLTIKAMLWVETGAHREREWRTRPMQIGNPTDPGMLALLGDRDGVTATSIATRYNVGDSSYARKLNHTLSAVRRTKEVTCR